MKTTLHYSTFITLCVHACGMTAQVDMGCKPLEEVFDYVGYIFTNGTFFHADCVESVHVIDSNTGELIAECEPDKKSEELDSDGWTMYDAIDEADLEMGFNPYEGCYDYDC